MTATIAEVEFRVARGRDARALARLIVVCLATYRDWAPDGWRLPASIELRELAGWNRRLRSERQRTLVACDPAGEIIGIVSWGPLAGQPAPDASTAHVDHLFVAPDYWGAGLARLLHGRALAEMRARGFHHAQLY
jgi:GNAT superfamily N-acetyltransferase